jgi:hypothetical protein
LTSERTERIDLGERNLVRDATQMGRDPVRDRRAETVVYFRVIDADGNASLRIDFHRPQ